MNRLTTGATGLALGLVLLAVSPMQSMAATTESASKTVEQGRDLAFSRSKGNCLACHQIEGGELAGSVGPPLVQMKARFPERDQLFDRIWDETQVNPMTVMPPFGRHKILEKQEINKIIDFLYTL